MGYNGGHGNWKAERERRYAKRQCHNLCDVNYSKKEKVKKVKKPLLEEK